MNRKPDPYAFPPRGRWPEGPDEVGRKSPLPPYPKRANNAQAQNQMYKCETSDPQAKGYVPSWYIPLFLGRIFRPEKLLLRRKLVKSAKCFSIQKTNCAKSRGPNPCTSVEYLTCRIGSGRFGWGSAVPSREFAVPMRKSLYLNPPNKPRNVRFGARFCFPLPPPGKKFAPCPAQTLHRPFIIL